jgi:hypothetical protein
MSDLLSEPSQTPWLLDHLIEEFLNSTPKEGMEEFLDQDPPFGELAIEVIRHSLNGFRGWAHKRMMEDRPALMTQGDANFSVQLQSGVKLSFAPHMEHGTLQPHSVQPVTGPGTRTEGHMSKTEYKG